VDVEEAKRKGKERKGKEKDMAVGE